MKLARYTKAITPWGQIWVLQGASSFSNIRWDTIQGGAIEMHGGSVLSLVSVVLKVQILSAASNPVPHDRLQRKKKCNC